MGYSVGVNVVSKVERAAPVLISPGTHYGVLEVIRATYGRAGFIDCRWGGCRNIVQVWRSHLLFGRSRSCGGRGCRKYAKRHAARGVLVEETT